MSGRLDQKTALVELDTRRRVSLAKIARHTRYLVTITEEGTIIMSPAIVRSEAEDRVRATPGLIEKIESEARDPKPASGYKPKKPRRR
jgi:hypothetical protein